MPTSGKLPTAGYSGKSLPDKLGYKPGTVAAFLALPDALAGLADSVPFAKITRGKDWSKPLPAGAIELIHAFTTSHEARPGRREGCRRRRGVVRAEARHSQRAAGRALSISRKHHGAAAIAPKNSLHGAEIIESNTAASTLRLRDGG